MEYYGNGPSTGLDQTAAGKIITGFTPADLTMSPEDRQVLRRLAERVAGIAASTRMKEVRDLWKRINTLQRTRPAVFCDPENGWNEIITEAQMECRGRLARRWEMDLRKEIFWGEEMGDDKPVEPFFDVPYTVSPDDWGVAAVYHKTEACGSYVWEAPIRDYKTDLKRVHAPQFEIDWETTRGTLQIAQDVFAGILAVRQKGIWWWSLGLTWPAATLRGLSNMMVDFVDHPNELKELFATISRGYLQKLDYLEANGLLSLNNDGTYVGRRRIFPARASSATCVYSPRARRRSTSPPRCTRSSCSRSKSRSWTASGSRATAAASRCMAGGRLSAVTTACAACRARPGPTWRRWPSTSPATSASRPRYLCCARRRTARSRCPTPMTS